MLSILVMSDNNDIGLEWLSVGLDHSRPISLLSLITRILSIKMNKSTIIYKKDIFLFDTINHCGNI